MDLIFGTCLTSLLLATFHWFPYAALFGRPMPRLLAYALGVISILAGAALWLGLAGDWQTVLGLVVISSVGGLVTALAHAIDRHALALSHERMAERELNVPRQ